MFVTSIVSAMVMTMSLGVRIYDNTAVPARDFATARATVEQTLKRASIEVVWRDCSGTGACDEPVREREVVLRVVSSAGTGFAPDSLGYALVDVRAHTGTLATIFEDRVTAMARRAGFDAGRLLGLAIAHEIGHMLLGTSAHASCGLMRAHWFDDELRSDAPGAWAWSRGEQAAMKRYVR